MPNIGIQRVTNKKEVKYKNDSSTFKENFSGRYSINK